MITRRHALLLAATAAVAGCAPSPGGERPTTSGASTPITVGLTYIPNAQFSAFYLGVQRDIFARHGLDVKLRHHGQQEDLFGAVLSGAEDVVFAGADEGVVAAAAGHKLVTFAVSYQRYPAEVITYEQAASLEFLRGKTLDIPGHFGSNYFAALLALREAGLTTRDVTLQDIGYTQVSALTTGKVDAIVGFTNNDLVQLRAATDRPEPTALPVTDPQAPALVGPSLLTVAGRFDAATLGALAAAMKEAEAAVVADREAALEATAREVPALSDPGQLDNARRVLAATTELWLKDGAVDVSLDPATLDRMAAFLHEAGVIDAVPEEIYVRFP